MGWEEHLLAFNHAYNSLESTESSSVKRKFIVDGSMMFCEMISKAQWLRPLSIIYNYIIQPELHDETCTASSQSLLGHAQKMCPMAHLMRVLKGQDFNNAACMDKHDKSGSWTMDQEHEKRSFTIFPGPRTCWLPTKGNVKGHTTPYPAITKLQRIDFLILLHAKLVNWTAKWRTVEPDRTLPFFIHIDRISSGVKLRTIQ